MTRRTWGILNFLRPEWRAEPERVSDFGEDDYRDGPSDLEVAFELLVLSNHLDLAVELGEILKRARKREIAILEPSEADELVKILESAARWALVLVDEKERVPLDRIDDLRARSEMLNFSDVGGHYPEDAVSEGIARVWGVREAIIGARARGLDVSLH